ncbi:MAG TPA: U32 family peptidase [Methanomicrobiales archaeon]|nr:U32 family peptidase [Methanomicrobiales archaeon]
MERPPAVLPELLAPAGTMEALRAAVSCGADAVYLGGKRFSARQYAGNFDDRGLSEAIDFAHARGVRVYIAVNILLHDRELPDAAAYLAYLYEIGADAILVQDPGFAALARELVPSLPLHASTQMTIHNRAGLEWAASLGLRRVVLARELSLAEVEVMGEIARRLGIGLEVFLHGALCYSYSGQCLLSSAIGGRSGNRGRCAQPCRKPYELVRGDADPYGRPLRATPVPLAGRYLLSTKDLSLYPYLDRVARAPVAALKIEGRMRSPEYVATVTGIYRRALDAIAAGSRVTRGAGIDQGGRGPSGEGDWSPSPADEETLALTFSRGFTGGCLCEGSEALMGRDAPDHRGILVGMVESVDPRTGSIGVRLSGQIVPGKGDGLVFRVPGDDEKDQGLILRHEPVIDRGLLWLKARREITGDVQPGARLFITHGARLAGSATCPPGSRVSVDLRLDVIDGRPVLEGSIFLSGNPITVIHREAGFTAEPARAHALTGEEVREILSKRGESPFRIGKIQVTWPSGWFARKGDIGGLRRDLLADVEKALVLAGRPDAGGVRGAREKLKETFGGAGSPAAPSPRGRSPQTLMVMTDSLDGVSGIASEGKGYIAFEPAVPIAERRRESAPGSYPWEEIGDMLRKAAALVTGTGWTLIWKWPRITGDSWIKGALGIPKNPEISGLSGLMVDGPGAAHAAAAAFPGLPLHGGAGLNVWNAETLRLLAPMFRSLTLSPELSREDIGDLLSRLPRNGCPLPGFFVEGNLELMVSEDRLAGLVPDRRVGSRRPGFIGIRDATSRIFPVEADPCGRTRILNAVETCLIDQLPALSALGVGLLSIDARGRGPRYGREMAAVYRQAIALGEAGGEQEERGLGDLREECRRLARGGITRGAFLRGLAGDGE